MKYPHLAARLYNAPLLVHPDKATVIEQVFRAHLLGEATPAANPEDFLRPEAAMGALKFRPRGDKPYAVTEGGVAILPVVGTLVQRADSLDAMSGLIGYNRLERQLAAAIDDAEVRGIVLEIDSPGGEANGCFDLARRLVEARAAKPLWAVANEQAFSAAYALACAAERLVVPPTGLVGSIGVIAMHVDQSKRDSQQGYSYTAVYAGARKNDFSSHAPLSPKAAVALQTEVDRLYDIFVTHVAAARGLDAKRVRATEAGLLDPETALAGGFVDAIASFGDTVAELEARLNRIPGGTAFLSSRQAQAHQGVPGAGVSAPSHAKETAMSEQTDKPAATTDPAAPPQPAASPVDVEAIQTAARAAGRTEERARIGAILGADEAKGRGALASHLAFETDMGADEARKLLAKSPVEAGGNGGFAAAMAALGNPNVGADVCTEDAGKPRIDQAAIYEARRAPSGRD